MNRLSLKVCTAVAVAFLLAASANAASFPPVPPPLDPGESDAFTVFKPDGSVSQRVSAFEADETDQIGPDSFFFVGGKSLANPNPPPITIILNPDGTFSDAFGVDTVSRGNTGTGKLFFVSDGEVSFFGPVSGIQETPNGVYNATAYLNPALQRAGWTATFQSDVDPVPEPTSLALLGLALAGFAGARRLRRQ